MVITKLRSITPIVVIRKEHLNLFVWFRSWLITIKQVNQAHSQRQESVWDSGSARRQSLFLIQEENVLIFITCHEGLEKRLHCKDFQQIRASLLTEHVFGSSQRRKNLPRSNSYRWLALCLEDGPVLRETKNFVSSILFGVIPSDGNIVPPCCIQRESRQYFS